MKLFDRVYGCIVGSAIGDAMGGPVEGLDWNTIAAEHGRVESLLPYTAVQPSYHGPFGTAAGCYTDDTRISLILADAAIHARGMPKRGDIRHALASYYFNSKTDLERGFVEEYYLKAMYGEDKEAFGGRPTNGGIMGIASLGTLFPADPELAFSHVFRTLFISTGTARTASAYAAALIAAAMVPNTTWEQIVSDAESACRAYKREVEASGWRNSTLYPIVARKTETLVARAVELGTAAPNVDSLRQDLYDAVVQPFFADGSESLALAVAMFCAARGDYREAVTGCVNFGRDNDSSAAVAGAIAGALCGAKALPAGWVETVEQVNPTPSLRFMSERLTGYVAARCRRIRRTAEVQARVMFTSDPAEPAEDGQTLPDIAASETGNHAARLERRLERGADPDQCDASGKSALHVAAAGGDTDSIALLLLYGADINIRDKNQTTPLHFAAWENHLSAVHQLLARGADPDLAEGIGWTPLHDAVRREYTTITCTLLAASRGLTDPDATASALQKNDGDERFLELLSLLHDQQVRLGSVGICGQSLLHDAVERGYRRSAAYLVAHDADVNQLALSFGNTTYEGTPLHKAAAYGHMDIYDDLVAAGGDETIQNIDGLTPPEILRSGKA